MEIIIISSWYSENMGYAENCLPKAFSQLGHNVNVITSNVQIYYNSPNYKEIYEPFIGHNIVGTGIKIIDGFNLHRLPYFESRKGVGIKNLQEYIVKLKPDIIQTFNIDELATYDAAIVSQRHGFKLFTESHLHASVFPEHSLKIRLKRFLNKYSKFLKLINDATVKCYPISTDAAEIAISYYRVPESKVKIQSLGVDTDLFKPCISESLKKERKELRTKLGFVDSDIVCIYTGRFTKDKNPHCLAQALHRLHNIDASYKGLFVGGGTSSDLNFIQSQSGCHVHPFVRVDKLPAFYRAADIGVWPAQESTSQLDAMACGLPIILSNKIKVFERVQGNGLLYEENNYVDLANKITELRDNHIRETMLQYGVDKIIKNYSWIVIAQERLKDYYQSMRYGGNI